MKKHNAHTARTQTISIPVGGIPISDIARSAGRFSMPGSTESNLECDHSDAPACDGPLHRWMLKTTLGHWPVIRCENHIRLQRLWRQYQEKWYQDQGEWYQQDWSKSPLSFRDWLISGHWNENTTLYSSDFKYWSEISQQEELKR